MDKFKDRERAFEAEQSHKEQSELIKETQEIKFLLSLFLTILVSKEIKSC